MRHTFRLAALSMVAIASVALTGCATGNTAGESGSSTESKGAVALSFPTLDVAIWNDVIAYVEPIVNEAGYDLLVDNANNDIQAQAAAWQAWIQRGDVKAIMGYPAQSDSLVAVTDEALAAGIPVLGYAVSWAGVSASALADSRADGVTLGQAAGEWIIEHYGDDDTVPVSLLGYWDNDLGRDRSEGIVEGLEASGANVDISEQTAATVDEGYSVTQGQLTAAPGTKVWLNFASDPAVGSYQALMDSGVAPDDPDVLFGALDATDDVLDLVSQKNSIWRLSYSSRAEDIATAVADMLISAAGGTIGGDVQLPVIAITAENADDFRTK